MASGRSGRCVGHDLVASFTTSRTATRGLALVCCSFREDSAPSAVTSISALFGAHKFAREPPRPTSKVGLLGPRVLTDGDDFACSDADGCAVQLLFVEPLNSLRVSRLNSAG